MTNSQLPIMLLSEALESPPTLFGRSKVLPLDSSAKTLRRTQKRLNTLFENLSGGVLEANGILHEKSGMVFAETRIGSFDYLLSCFTSKSQPLRADLPLEIVTGICMFGAGSIMGQAGGKRYDLTYPDDTKRVQGLIKHIVTDERLHLYEAEAITRLGKCINALCGQVQSIHTKLTVHLPVPEYFIYGLDLYARGHMSNAALREYMAAVSRKGDQLESKLRERFSADSLKLNVNSPLSWIQNIDLFALRPDEVSEVLYAQAAKQDELWQRLVRGTSGQPLQLNYLSYTHQYLQAAKRMQDTASQLVFLENPEELPIYLNAVKWQKDLDITVDKATVLYVHPRIVVNKKAYADHGNFLYFCADGFNEQAIALAVSQYEPDGHSYFQRVSSATIDEHKFTII